MLVEEDGVVLVFAAPSPIAKETWLADFFRVREEAIKQNTKQFEIGMRIAIEKTARIKAILEKKYLELDKRRT